MRLERSGPRFHVRKEAGVDPTLWWVFKPGQRVMTREGLPGVVEAVEDGPYPGSEHYIVTLDGGMGGGEYDSSELADLGETPGRTVTAAREDVVRAIREGRPRYCIDCANAEGGFDAGWRNSMDRVPCPKCEKCGRGDGRCINAFFDDPKTAHWQDTPESDALSEQAAMLLSAANDAMEWVAEPGCDQPKDILHPELGLGAEAMQIEAVRFENHRGVKIKIKQGKGRDWGSTICEINGHDYSYAERDEERVLSTIRATIDQAIDNDPDHDRFEDMWRPDHKGVRDPSAWQGHRCAALETREWEGQTGNRDHITCRQTGTVPTSAVANLMGVMGEIPGAHARRSGPEWDAFKADIAANGIREAIFITVDYGQAPRISEGNHRRDAAVELGLLEVPVEISYFGHAEERSKIAGNVWDLMDRSDAAENRRAKADEAGKEPCVLCGRAIADQSKAIWIEVSIDGEIIPEGDPRSNTEESQGAWIIGPECIKKVRRTSSVVTDRAMQFAKGVADAIGIEMPEGMHTAADDYPELGSILVERPDHRVSITAGLKLAQIDPGDPEAGEREVRDLMAENEFTHVGLAVKAADSGRVLLTQRTPYDGDDEEVRGRWEFPGGGIDEKDEDAIAAAFREFGEETGLEPPEKLRIVGGQKHGKYLLIMALVPNEAWTVDACLLDFEVMGLGWFHPDLIEKATDLVRKEMDSTEWDMIREAKRVLASEGEAPYPKPGKCEGQTRDPNHVGRRPFQGPAMGRCQQTEDLQWHEGAYAWLCPNHIRGANRRKTSGFEDPDYYRNTGLYEEDPVAGEVRREEPLPEPYECNACVGGFAEDGSICTYCRGTTVAIRTQADGSGRLLDFVPQKAIDWLADKSDFEPGHNPSYDWCRFRRDSRCYYPKTLDEVNTKRAGYAVWIPEDRGYCPRVKWKEQQTCPVGEPGPHSKDPKALPDATHSYDEGGQRFSVIAKDNPFEKKDEKDTESDPFEGAGDPDFEESEHPRDDDGKFVPKTTGPRTMPDSASETSDPVQSEVEGVDEVPPTDPSASTGGGPLGLGNEPPDDGSPGSKSNPVPTDDIEEAARLLGEGKYVALEQPKQISTLLDTLAQQIKQAEASGQSLKINLCQVSVEGTNLFCVESKGIPRIQMPQLKSKNATPGSRVTQEVEPNAKGEYDIQPLFRKRLEEMGYTVTEERELAANLKATQNELDTEKIAGMTDALLEKGTGALGDDQIFVSSDDYIVDGHHRWAGNIAADWEDGDAEDISMSIARVNLSIIELLAEANRFATEMGIPQAAVHASLKRACCDDCAQKTGRLLDIENLTPGTVIDEHGTEKTVRTVVQMGQTYDDVGEPIPWYFIQWADGTVTHHVPRGTDYFVVDQVTMGYRHAAMAIEDHEFGFHFTAAWRDVQDKAKRIRTSGGVRIIASTGTSVTAEVRGDTALYQTSIMRFGKSVAMWECGCKWGAYSWGRSGRWTKYEGRMCSHALAVTYEAQAQEMFGGETQEQANKPTWRNDPTVPVNRPGDQKLKNGPWRVGVLEAWGWRPVETDPSLHTPPALVMASALLEDYEPNEAAVKLAKLGAADPMRFIVQAVKGFPFRARIRGRMEDVFGITPGGMFETSVGEVFAADILYPTYDDSLGLSLRDSTAGQKMAEVLPQMGLNGLVTCSQCGNAFDPLATMVGRIAPCPQCMAQYAVPEALVPVAAYKLQKTPEGYETIIAGRTYYVKPSNEPLDGMRGPWWWVTVGASGGEYSEMATPFASLRDVRDHLAEVERVEDGVTASFDALMASVESDAIALLEAGFESGEVQADVVRWYAPTEAGQEIAREEVYGDDVPDEFLFEALVVHPEDKDQITKARTAPAAPDAGGKEAPKSGDSASTPSAPAAAPSAAPAATASLDEQIADIMAALHDEPEPALPETDGAEAEIEEVPLEQLPGHPALAHLMKGTPAQEGEGPSDSDIAARARAVLAGKTFTPAEQKQIIDEGEGVTASNLDLLDIKGTHYMQLEESLAAQEDDMLDWAY